MKKKASIGCLFWVALILLVLVVFAFNKNRIDQVMEATGFMEIITQTQPEPTIVDKIQPEEPVSRPAKPEPREQTVEIVVTEKEKPAQQNTQEAQATPAAVEKTEPQRNLRRGKLHFVQIEGEHGILKGVVRPVYYYDSPLTDTLKSLLRGPSTDELNMGLISLIPGDTAINSIKVSNGIASIDVTESFRFNSFGREGYRLQLMQIVYTATEFSTVKAVQFLINGTVHTYLGPEGVYIGGPLSRDSFK
ncbi:MAG: GerMN domain-containing protein [Spirochaetales bacterium]|nr:GerMN domain-containing protein [Spirochaetales bacterium]